jgi:tRNA (guanine37-N1)-methyltransferase
LNFKERLKEILTEEEYSIATFSYDQIGNIAIIDLPEELYHKEKEIGEALIKTIKPITTVCRKDGIHEGIFRTQPLKVIAGINTKVAEYKELGCRFKVDVEKVYFSPRLSTERERITSMIKPDERVLVMFSGCGIYPIIFSRRSPAKEIVGIEINPIAHEYALENITLNKCKNVTVYCGDVHKVLPTLSGTFDRIVMPLPKTAHEFLNDAKAYSHKGTILHFYAFEEESTMPEKTVETVNEVIDGKLISWAKCGPNKPGWFRICVDIEVN